MLLTVHKLKPLQGPCNNQMWLINITWRREDGDKLQDIPCFGKTNLSRLFVYQVAYMLGHYRQHPCHHHILCHEAKLLIVLFPVLMYRHYEPWQIKNYEQL